MCMNAWGSRVSLGRNSPHDALNCSIRRGHLTIRLIGAARTARKLIAEISYKPEAHVDQPNRRFLEAGKMPCMSVS